MSLHEESVAYRDKAKQMLGEKFNIFTSQIEALTASGAAKRSAQAGQHAPDFTLPDAHGSAISLSSLLAKGPVVLSFYRGEWCPFCNLELHAYQQVLPEIKALGATLVAVSPEKPDLGLLATEKNSLTFPVLSDLGNTVARAYGLVFTTSPEVKALQQSAFQLSLPDRNGDESWELPMPGTFVIDTQRIIRFAHVDPDYFAGRANPEEVLVTLRGIKESLVTA
ncbi:MAG TPA: peroxiredoxin-like family protein [Terracidiphilus sp.]|jgi:peroxiredoxin|nr:peroxiredoxin-like family protein [Terracidiphilus sp.]